MTAEHIDKLPPSEDINYANGCMHCGRTDTELYNYVCNAGCSDEGADDRHRIWKRTPGNWYNNGGRIESIVKENFPPIVVAQVGEVNNQYYKDTANAEFIVRACNAHEKLVDICEYINEFFELDAPTKERLRIALAAKGESGGTTKSI
jgi:hypothetical protein